MEYTHTSMMISRKKDRRNGDREVPYLVLVKFFSINDPHQTPELPKKELYFEKITRVVLEGFTTHYLPEGNDLVFNDIGTVTIVEEGEEIHIKKM